MAAKTYERCPACRFPKGHTELCCGCPDCRGPAREQPCHILPTAAGGPTFADDDAFAVRRLSAGWGSPPLGAILSGRAGWMVWLVGEASGAYSFAPKVPHTPEGIFPDRAAAEAVLRHLSDRIASSPGCTLSVHLVRIQKEE